MMNINEKFEELFICGEKHDIVNFNRQMTYLIREISVNSRYDVGILLDELDNQFREANLCSECETSEELQDDQIVIDGEKIFLKVCPSCESEIEV